MIIDGISYRDIIYPPAEITFLDGGLGFPFITINVVMQPKQSVNAMFTFFKSPRFPDDLKN